MFAAAHAASSVCMPGISCHGQCLTLLLHAEWRPPRGTDGTPNESISDVLVRVRQVRAHPYDLEGECLPSSFSVIIV